jgi:hypothetical protein
VAPGGDSVFGVTAAAPNGRVLSTYPASRPCSRKVVDNGATYCYLQGTWMASPHVAGVAALVISQFGTMATAAVAGYVQQTADAQPCPDPMPAGYPTFFPSLDDGRPEVCTGGPTMNSWYGHGQVNALHAVTNDR